MTAKVTVANARIYTKIGDELVVAAGAGIPGANANATNFRALANMTNAGMALFEVDGVDYAIPLLLNA